MAVFSQLQSALGEAGSSLLEQSGEFVVHEKNPERWTVLKEQCLEVIDHCANLLSDLKEFALQAQKTVSLEDRNQGEKRRRKERWLSSASEMTEMALWELANGRLSIEELRDDDPRLPQACSKSCRQTLMALFEIDSVFARINDEAPVLHPLRQQVTEESLRIRKLFARLSKRVNGLEEDKASNFSQKLRLIAVTLAWLVGHPRYMEIRPNDRSEIRSIQDRINKWLSQEEPPARGRMAEELWQDTMALSHLVMRINARPELIEFDRKAEKQKSKSDLAKTLTLVSNNAHAG